MDTGRLVQILIISLAWQKRDFFFFFQAEDGIRDLTVTGVQTCALPISDDDSIPFTESLRLAEAAGPRARVVVLETFHHTGPGGVSTALYRRVADGAALDRKSVV